MILRKKSGMVYAMKPFALVIFGISGNLAQIKLIPVLHDMAEKDLLPENMTIVGISRKKWSQEEFQKYLELVITVRAHAWCMDVKQERRKMSKLIGEVVDEIFCKRTCMCGHDVGRYTRMLWSERFFNPLALK